MTDQAKTAPEHGQIVVTPEMKQRFDDWFVENYPGPDTIIHNPHWHAPRIFRAALHCVSKSVAEQAIAEADRRCDEWVRNIDGMWLALTLNKICFNQNEDDRQPSIAELLAMADELRDALRAALAGEREER